jgi:hypothetical protein
VEALMLRPPAVRFVRCFDPFQCKMLNLWFSLNTQAQIDDAPRATELTVQAKTVEDCMKEIRTWEKRLMLTPEQVEKIEKAAAYLKPAKDPLYGICR